MICMSMIHNAYLKITLAVNLFSFMNCTKQLMRLLNLQEPKVGFCPGQ